MKTLLLYPPISDPTSGYHSLCYLETFARSKGFLDIDILDTNIEALLYSMSDDQIQIIQNYVRDRLQELENMSSLTPEQQLELYHLWKASQYDYDNLKNAIGIMRDEDAFYDYTLYRPAAELIERWLDVLSIFGYPGQFTGLSLPVRYLFNLCSSKDMANHDVVNKIAGPFMTYFQNVLLPKVQEMEYQAIGINVTYCAQLPFALAISRIIRNQFPEMVIFFGGTEVADVWKYLDDKRKFFDIFDAADACVIGEGEVAFTKLLERVENNQPFEPLPNVLFHDKYNLSTLEPQIEFGKIFDLPTPDYSKLPQELYLSPHPYVYYSPSRGCYWNKCTFCDYGLNFDSPTSPWRQNPIEKIMDDLREITSHSIKHVYFSVDVLAPAMLLNLAEKILEDGLDVRWGAEIRLEKYWSTERCAMLKASGCTDISVGYESGNQRILDLIDKGTQVQRVSETIYNFSQANIGVQVMGFTGFPTETFEEAMESVHFLTDHRDYWTFGGLGQFSLTPGSIVAKDPERFLLQNVKPFVNEDISRSLYFEDQTANRTSEQNKQLKEAKKRLDKNNFNRPWVGGVDTAHTMFYHEKYGKELLGVTSPVKLELEPDQEWFLNGKITPEPNGYSVENLFKDNHVFGMQAESNVLAVGLANEQIESILVGKNKLEKSTQSGKRYFVRNDGTLFPFSESMLEFLSFFDEGNTLNKVLSMMPEDDHNGVKKLVEHCVSHHFVRNKKIISLQNTENLANV